MTTIENIPLKNLIAWDGNVRKTAGADTALAELAASIAAHGLLQSLVVRKEKRGTYAVVAGKRRLRALTLLAAEGQIDDRFPVPCHVIAAEANATEISLAENAVREQMHPADEFEAFRALADTGMPPADIAARFGVTENVVLKRLRLARVSPVLLEAYRKDETTLQCLMAFAVSDDIAEQERIWREAPAWMTENPRSIRDALTEREITATDARVQFVSLKAYEKAGGAVRRDLFSQDDEGVFITDSALLEGLVAKKLEKAAKAVRKEGWKWVEARPALDYDDLAEMTRMYPEPVPLTEEEATELATLEAEADAFNDLESELDDDQQARFDAVCNRIDELNEREEIFPAETFAIAGAVVTVDREGDLRIERGFVRPEDAPEETESEEAMPDSAVKSKPAFPASLTQSLTEHRTAALAAALCERPDVALAAVVHAFALDLFRSMDGTSCVEVSATAKRLEQVKGYKAAAMLAGHRESWGDRLPGNADALWDWCLEQDQAILLDLLAYCAARTVNAVQAKADRPGSARLMHADALARALSLDMGDWFTPTAENYFGRIAKPQILAALQEAKGVPPAPAWSSLKKGELALLAEREVAATPWLPEILRTAA